MGYGKRQSWSPAIRHPELSLPELLAYTAHQIEREDGQINNRLTWMLTFHGFLFLSAAAVLSQNELEASFRRRFVATVAVVGVVVCVVALCSIRAAVVSLSRIRKGWETIEDCYSLDKRLVVRPYGTLSKFDRGHWIAYAIPASIMGGWILVAAFTWVALRV